MSSARRGRQGESPMRQSEEAAAAVRPMDAICAFVANAPIAVAALDRDLRFLKASPAWLSDFGAEESELIGRGSYETAPDTIKYAEKHQRCLAGETVSGDPEPVELPNGYVRWVTWDASPWRDEHGEIGGILIISRDVTAQMEAQEEARRARSFLATVLENVPLGIMAKDAQGRFLMLNRATEDIYGFRREELLGREIGEVRTASIGEQVSDEDALVLEHGAPMVFESPVLTRHNGERVLQRVKVAVQNEDGPDYMLVVVEDVTERRREQQELERTRAFLGTVIDTVPVGLTIRDTREGRVVVMNAANEALLGQSRDDVIGKTVHELFPPEDAAERLAEDRRILESGRVWEMEQDLETPHRGLRHIRKLRVGITAQDGSSYVMSITDDITDQKSAQSELERTRGFLETVIENIPVALTVRDAQSRRLLVVNPAFEAQFYTSRDQDKVEAFRKEQSQRFLAQDQEVIRTGEMLVMDEEPVMTSAGLRHLNRRKVLIRNADGPDYLLTISEDVTERKLAKDALEDALARAEAANVAKSEFLANMSHEIRTPLNGVLGLADALARMQLTPPQQDIVGMIVSSGKALTAILSDVLDLAKAEAGQLDLREESFSLRETIGSAAHLFETVARDKGLDFIVDFAADGPDRLTGDPLRLRQIVSNLISNAVKFTAAGKVSVKAGARPAEDGAAVLEVTVRDTGPGITEQARAKLFGRFEQGDGSITRQYGGTGLGLSIAATLANMMGGEITCASKVGEGASFTLSIRARIEGADSAPPSAEQTVPVRAPGQTEARLRVLLAEDHLVNQKVVQLMLEGAAELVIVGNGQEALDAALSQGPFDVVLMDMQMPVMDGMSATREIRRAETAQGRPRTPIIALTANAMAHQVQATLEAGADLHLAKPITADGLYRAIDQVLEKAQAMGQPQRPVARAG
jgi:PAS domain S-box-containing protein